jgi:hypothetical protein
VVLNGLECARIGSNLIFNCQNVTQDEISERIVKMNFSRPVFSPTVSILLNEYNVPKGPLDVQATSFYDGACGKLTLPESAIIFRDEGHTITLGCSGPLQVSGSESITCNVTDGTWKPQVGTEWPECVPVEPQLEEPPLSHKHLQENETWTWISIGACGVGVVFSLIGYVLFK